MMLPLDSPRWNELTHAHGRATDTPGLLRRLSAGDNGAEVLEAMSSSLFHQGDPAMLGTASYAAVPHIVAAASAFPPVERLGLLVLAMGIVAGAADAEAKEVPNDLREGLEGALEAAKRHAAELLFARAWQPDEAVYVLGVLAVLLGQKRLGASLFDGVVACDACGTDQELFGQEGLFG